MKVNNFENEMLITISKYHRHPLPEIKKSYDAIKQFDKVITLINFADEYNYSLEYMTDLFLRLIRRPSNAFKTINELGQNGELRDSIKETMGTRRINGLA